LIATGRDAPLDPASSTDAVVGDRDREHRVVASAIAIAGSGGRASHLWRKSRRGPSPWPVFLQKREEEDRAAANNLPISAACGDVRSR
jgi:hypothetical protein